MIKVPILVFEDAPLADSKDLRELLDFPRQENAGGQDYTFDWHDTYNALGGGANPVLIRSVEAYREAASFLRNQLSGEAIIFMDLEMVESSSAQAFSLAQEDITDDLLEAAIFLDDRVRRKSNVLKHFNPQRVGVLLALNAAHNPNWQGLIVFASGRADVNVEQLRQCVKTGDRIGWQSLQKSLSADKAFTPLVKATALNGVIDEFLELRAGPPFWPTGTEDWFESPESMPPHTAPSDSNQAVVGNVRTYLEQLLGGFIPPESWFRDPQWTTLYEALKGLIGACSVSGRTPPGEKNLRLVAVPLLLAAQIAWKDGDIKWLGSFEWNVDALIEIMAHDNKVDAQEAIRAMAVFLEHLSVGKNGGQVIGAIWGKVADDKATHLWIDFDIDPLSRATGRSLLQTIFGLQWGNSIGQTVGAYENMMKRAPKPGPSSAPKFSLCIYPIVDAKGQTITRLDFRSLGV